MNTEYNISLIFPTPLYTNIIPEDLLIQIREELNNESLIGKDKNISEEDFGLRSEDSYILNKSKYRNINSYILQHATNYAENYLAYNYINYKFSQSWVSVKKPNQEHRKHIHANSLISGVLFYENEEKDTSEINFHRKDDYSGQLGHHKLKEYSQIKEYNKTIHSIPYTANLLILFPSFLSHSVSKNITGMPRKSLAFNIVPRDGFGCEEHLNQLKF